MILDQNTVFQKLTPLVFEFCCYSCCNVSDSSSYFFFVVIQNTAEELNWLFVIQRLIVPPTIHNRRYRTVEVNKIFLSLFTQ